MTQHNEDPPAQPAGVNDRLEKLKRALTKLHHETEERIVESQNIIDEMKTKKVGEPGEEGPRPEKAPE